MYLDYFHISRKPFELAPDPEFFYLTESARRAHDGIDAAIRQCAPFLLLTGRSGTGKTTLLNYMMGCGDSSVHWIIVDPTKSSGEEFWQSLTHAVGLTEADYRRSTPGTRLTAAMAALASQSLHPVVVIDPAGHLPHGTWQQVIEWQVANQIQGVKATVILTGAPSFAAAFNAIDQGPLRDQKVGCVRLEHFNPQEVETVVAYRLKIAGYSGPVLFPDDSFDAIYKLSTGLPRLINQICDLALFIAARRKQSIVTGGIVRETSKFLDLALVEESDLLPVTDTFAGPTPSPALSGHGAISPRSWVNWGVAMAGLLILCASGVLWYHMRPSQLADQRTVEKQRVPQITLPSPAPSVAVDVAEVKPAVQPRIMADASEQSPDVNLGGVLPAGGPDTTHLPPATGSRPAAKPLDTVSLNPRPSPALTPLAAASPLPIMATEPPPRPIPAPEVQPEQEAASITLAAIPDPLPTPQPAPPTQAPQVQASAPPSQPHPQGGDLIRAVEKGRLPEVNQLLRNGAGVDSVNADGDTALMKAAWAGRVDILQLLLDRRPTIDQQGREGWTALFYGAVRGHQSIVATLLANHARPDVADRDGRTPLMAAAWNGHAEIVALLLKWHGNPNARNRDGWTPLMFAALKGDLEVTEVLLHHGADPALKSLDGTTGAELAAHGGFSEIASLLAAQRLL